VLRQHVHSPLAGGRENVFELELRSRLFHLAGSPRGRPPMARGAGIKAAVSAVPGPRNAEARHLRPPPQNKLAAACGQWHLSLWNPAHRHAPSRRSPPSHGPEAGAPVSRRRSLEHGGKEYGPQFAQLGQRAQVTSRQQHNWDNSMTWGSMRLSSAQSSVQWPGAGAGGRGTAGSNPGEPLGDHGSRSTSSPWWSGVW